ncbi:MAG: universal stress protein [Chloroflexi bacterium]|nr:universal stress protein [Chloroflexota bacterium]MBK7180154.1 universal stress protein [Chloroflexota bacterium]
MTQLGDLRHEMAVRDFRRARREASLQQLLARMTGKPTDLLAYNDVSTKLKISGGEELGVQEIPLDAIVGSVGRYQDFTRSFMPRSDQDAERWVRVKTAVNDMTGMPPIDVYKVGDAYFVIDGNHRVSVARQLGGKTISARVMEVNSRVPLSNRADATEIICKSRYLEFLEYTNLDKLFTDVDLSMTFAGNYRALLAQIDHQREHLIGERGEPVTYHEAVADWYETIYMPIIRLIREQGVLHNFPERTEADMYILLSERREELEEALGWDVDLETAVSDLANLHSPAATKQAIGIGERLLDVLRPEGFEDGPEPGQWRREWMSMRGSKRLFARILVPMRGGSEDWHMLDQALDVARREKGRLLGLHVVDGEDEIESAAASNVKMVFDGRCENTGVRGEMVVTSGNISRTIIERAAYADLVVVNLMNPPVNKPLARLGSGFTLLIQRSPRPLLVVPGGRGSGMKRALVAYDGSPKASEALFVAAYLALRWRTALTVLTVETQFTSADALQAAQKYLADYDVRAEYVLREKPIAEAVLETAVTYNNDLLIMGGFGFRPVQHMVLGSTVDQMLHEFRYPMLICR